MSKLPLRLALVPALLWLAAASPLPALEPSNLYPHKQELRAYVESGEYARSVADVALSANKYLVKRIHRGAKPGQKLAVVFDIDETALSNLPHILADDFGYIPRLWDAWVAEGQARAIVPIQTVYETAVRAKVDVFFITGRSEAQRAATERNLREVGYDTWTRIIYLPPGDTPPTMARFKTEARKRLTAEGYVIIANIGDQASDLVNGYADRTFKLPNPFYLAK
ncbi:MAG TPA: HAD family acid phosphatase [Lacunisphaera sp.]|jgi:predicted secreted acid phosphatase|nr:HAD family acid phosphatase [Lacunisphaera sp.]